jgi:hypothetical protein
MYLGYESILNGVFEASTEIISKPYCANNRAFYISDQNYARADSTR